MLRTTSDLRSCRVHARDGELGKVRDLLFDDRRWITRYLVVDTRAWLPGRRVLIVPSALGPPDRDGGELPVDLTVEQVRESPGIDENRPVSREREAELHRYFSWNPYWLGPTADAVPPPTRIPESEKETRGDPNLRSADEVCGYGIRATDGEIGGVADFVVDAESWHVRYLVVDTGSWLPGKKVLISPRWIRSVEWSRRAVEVETTRGRIERAPAFDPAQPIDRGDEQRLFAHHEQPGYWDAS